jgi:FtsZ-binding cell division protein ZapB
MTTMANLHLKPNLVETSCRHIMNTVRSLPLNFNIVETPYSIYVTVRKSLLKSTQSLDNQIVVDQDEKIKKLEEANHHLKADLEEAVVESEEKAKLILDLKQTVKNLCDKLDTTEKNNLKLDTIKNVKDEEIETIKTKNKNLVTDNKNLRKDFRELMQELDRAKQESFESKTRLESQVGQLENMLKDQRSETKDVLRNIEQEKAELEFFRVQSKLEKKEIASQTDSHPDIPYLVTDPLPPIFSLQLRYKSRPINFLSRSIPNLSSILWCPPDDEYCDAADEYLADQYDREIEEFYLEAREQARVQHGVGQHGQHEPQGVPDDLDHL